MDMKPAVQPEQAGSGENHKSRVLCMLARKLLCNVNDTRALIGLCLLVMSHCGQIWEPWDSQAFTIAHIVIGLSLHIHSFIHLKVMIKNSMLRCCNYQVLPLCSPCFVSIVLLSQLIQGTNQLNKRPAEKERHRTRYGWVRTLILYD